MSGHVVRRATIADFDDVMSIGDFLFGADHLRNRYVSYMNDPDSRSFVYVIDNEIIGFCNVILVDDGMTLVFRGSRVKVKLQGQGLFQKLTHYVYKEYRRIPGIQFETFTTNSVNYKLNGRKLNKSFTLLSEKKIMNFYFKFEDIHLSGVRRDSPVQEMARSEFEALFTDENVRSPIFPGSNIIVNGISLRFIGTNIKHILTSERHILVSKNNDSLISLVTISTCFPCPMGIRYVVDVFGSDVMALRHHVISHLSRLRSDADQKTLFQLVLDQRIGPADVNETLQGLGLIKYDFPMKVMYEFGRRFRY